MSAAERTGDRQRVSVSSREANPIGRCQKMRTWVNENPKAVLGLVSLAVILAALTMGTIGSMGHGGISFQDMIKDNNWKITAIAGGSFIVVNLVIGAVLHRWQKKQEDEKVLARVEHNWGTGFAAMLAAEDAEAARNRADTVLPETLPPPPPPPPGQHRKAATSIESL